MLNILNVHDRKRNLTNDINLTQDVANFQIYTNKALLLSASCASSQAYFASRLNTGAPGGISADAARIWLHQSSTLNPHPPHHQNPEKPCPNTLATAIVNTLTPPNPAEPQPFPDCFKFDHARLQTLRAHIENLTRTQICVQALHDTISQCRHHCSSRKTLAESTRWLADVLPCIVGGGLRLGGDVARESGPCSRCDRLHRALRQRYRHRRPDGPHVQQPTQHPATEHLNQPPTPPGQPLHNNLHTTRDTPNPIPHSTLPHLHHRRKHHPRPANPPRSRPHHRMRQPPLLAITG